MKIEAISPPAIQLLPVESVAALSNSGLTGPGGPIGPGGLTATQGTQGATEDWTSFHSDSASVLSLTSQALSSPEVRQGTVDALRQSLNNGGYQVDATKIAAAISNSFGG